MTNATHFFEAAVSEINHNAYTGHRRLLDETEWDMAWNVHVDSTCDQLW